MGRSAARQMAEKGANVILVSRSASKLEEAMAEAKVNNSTSSTSAYSVASAMGKA
jgi:3-dehydrosphinganine reductase